MFKSTGYKTKVGDKNMKMWKKKQSLHSKKNVMTEKGVMNKYDVIYFSCSLIISVTVGLILYFYG